MSTDTNRTTHNIYMRVLPHGDDDYKKAAAHGLLVEFYSKVNLEDKLITRVSLLRYRVTSFKMMMACVEAVRECVELLGAQGISAEVDENDMWACECGGQVGLYLKMKVHTQGGRLLWERIHEALMATLAPAMDKGLLEGCHVGGFLLAKDEIL